MGYHRSSCNRLRRPAYPNRNQATSIRQFAKDKVKVEKKLVVLDSLIKQNNQNLYKVLDAAIDAKMEAADAKEKLKNQLKK